MINGNGIASITLDNVLAVQSLELFQGHWEVSSFLQSKHGARTIVAEQFDQNGMRNASVKITVLVTPERTASTAQSILGSFRPGSPHP